MIAYKIENKHLKMSVGYELDIPLDNLSLSELDLSALALNIQVASNIAEEEREAFEKLIEKNLYGVENE